MNKLTKWTLPFLSKIATYLADRRGKLHKALPKWELIGNYQMAEAYAYKEKLVTCFKSTQEI